MIRQAVICAAVSGRVSVRLLRNPKPLLRSGDTFLDVLLFELGRHGVTRILLLAGFGAHLVSNMHPQRVEGPIRPGDRCRVEPDPADTGGAVWHARDHSR